jgi:hypothetical protein
MEAPGMTATHHADESTRIVLQPAGWLPALEQELKSRIGWVDEAVSPFAAGGKPAQAQAGSNRGAIQTAKAA